VQEYPWFVVVVSMGGLQDALTCGGACGCSGESALGAVEEATAEAAKHGDRNEALAALVVEARAMLEQARVAEAKRARAAAEEAEAKAAAEAEAAVKRQQLERRRAALALELQQVQAELGSTSDAASPATPEVELCVLCLDAEKDHIIIPCGHQCLCGECAERLKRAKHPTCPLCRGDLQQTYKVFA
jgi:hypothetical protein